MKNPFLFLIAFSAMSFLASSQIVTHNPYLKTTSTSTVVNDVLHYYLNKHYFKTGVGNTSAYPAFHTDATGVLTATAITFCGSRFDVPAGETVTIMGLEAYVKKDGVTFVHPTIPIHLYLFHLDPLTGMPVMPIIDSIVCSIGTGAVSTPSLIGGNFTSSATIGARTMTSNFGVGIRNMSTSNGDFVYLLRTAGVTQTNTTAPASEKYGEGYGFVRYNGTFYSCKDFNLAPGFGAGTDYEFMVAPRVSYNLQASEILPQGVVLAGDPTVPDTMCTRIPLTFTNTSSAFFEHRQYNLNQFYRKWNLGSPFPAGAFPGVFSSDSSITWDFEFYDAQTNPPRDSRVFLPYVNTETVSAVTDLAYYPLCFTANHFRAHLKSMDAKGTGAEILFTEDFTVCLRNCNNDTSDIGNPPTGITSIKGHGNLNVYPNPTLNGKILLSGLNGKNTLTVYDILGQCILKEISENENYEINLTKQPKGTYVLRITGSENQTKAIKIIHEN